LLVLLLKENIFIIFIILFILTLFLQSFIEQASPVMHDALLLTIEIDCYRHFRVILSVHKLMNGAHHSAFAFKAISMALIMLETLTHCFNYGFCDFDAAAGFQLSGRESIIYALDLCPLRRCDLLEMLLVSFCISSLPIIQCILSFGYDMRVCHKICLL